MIFSCQRIWLDSSWAWSAWWAGRCQKTSGCRQQSENWSCKQRTVPTAPTPDCHNPSVTLEMDLEIEAPKVGAPSPAPPSLQQLVPTPPYKPLNMQIKQQEYNIQHEVYETGYWTGPDNRPVGEIPLLSEAFPAALNKFQGNNIWGFSCAMEQTPPGPCNWSAPHSKHTLICLLHLLIKLQNIYHVTFSEISSQ